MLFDELGIYGWDVVEPVIVAAVVADLPVLLIGDIGTNKTEGSKTIAQAVLRPTSQFRHYEVPTLNFDDLVGFLNPKGLAKGALEFVPTPLSIWQAEAALFDEINRANPFIQSKLHELIRTRHIMGLPTKLKLVFAAVNPPQTYQAGYMDLALASRFVSVQVPNLKSMKDTHLDRILSKNGHRQKRTTLKGIVRDAQRADIRQKDMQNAQNLAKKVARDLAQTDIVFNPRQLTMMVRLLLAGVALWTVTGNSRYSDPDANTAYVESVIPEIHGIVRSKVNKDMVHGTIRTVVGGFTLGDPVMIARNLEELAAVEVTDSLAWVTAMTKRVSDEDDPQALARVVAKVKDLTRREVIERELGEKLLRQLAIQLTTQTLLAEDVPVAELSDRATQILGSI
jgi:MoxR-like ATPase